jgi:transcriptional regulator with XRE-family HTH domain
MATIKKTRSDLSIKIGNNIRKWRELKCIKQEQLAKQLGITKGALSNIENDKTDIKLHRIEDIAYHLGIETSMLFKNPIDLILPPRKLIKNNLSVLHNS